jgi:MFS transporter, SP family, xylose:H+ symportor
LRRFQTEIAVTGALRFTLIATLGGFLFGYDTAVISGAVTAIDAYFVEPLGLSETLSGTLSGLTISSALFGCVLGGLIAARISDALGRRGGLILAAILFLCSAIGSALPELGLGPIGGMGPDALVPFVVYRILGGVGIGLASMLSPLYIAEIAPKEVRGRLVSYNQMAIVTGIVGVYFVNWAIARQGDDAWVNTIGWRWMLASEAIPALVFGLLLLRAPETPRWMVMKGRSRMALLVLHRLVGEREATVVLAEIETAAPQAGARLLSFGVGVVLVGVLLSVAQQFVGINAVLYYAPLIFRNMGLGGESALLQTVIVGAVNAAFTLVAIFTVDRLGRRPLLIAGALIMAAAMALLALMFQLDRLGLVAMLAILSYVAAFAFSWGPVVWVLLSEMFPAAIRSRALALAVAAQWIANLVVSWTFKIIDGSSALNAIFNHGFAYWLYALMSLCAAFLVWRFVPETRGHSLEAMHALWGARTAAETESEPETARPQVERSALF